MGGRVKYFLSSMNGVGDDDNLGDISPGCSLVDTASNSEHLGFCTCDKCSMIESFDERLIGNVCMRDRCSNVVFDTSI